MQYIYIQKFREAIDRTANEHLGTIHSTLETEKQFE